MYTKIEEMCINLSNPLLSEVRREKSYPFSFFSYKKKEGRQRKKEKGDKEKKRRETEANLFAR